MRIRLIISTLLIVLFFPCYSFAETTLTSTSTFDTRPAVQAFIQNMVKKYGFNKDQLTQLFSAVKVRPKVIRSIKAPLEQRPWHTYQRLFVTEGRIRNGVTFWDTYQTILTAVEKKYGVPASIIVATIGIETKYGEHTGEYPVIDALTNIGFSDSPRAPYFRSELEEFLLLTREQHLDPLTVMGSYAGAIGQPQFMPSSYRRYAVNFDGSHPIDLSHNEGDIIASIANFYKQKGWETNQLITVPASLIGNNYQFYLNKNKEIKIIKRTTLAEFGLPTDSIKKEKQPYKLLILQSNWGNEYWLTFHNFDVIKRYNASDLYAMSVFQLSHYLEVLRTELNKKLNQESNHA